ncbi:hypothetical protein RCL_jg25733.t2 [Rhizophagus clarus]|uniref:Uncharacterized protein n=1 Tax=Rhizophagus clarus TaxID=94130 RepID=A0A8H3LRR2_9GLOM|nr:hypothetical protein RCL_jg25733.t2 [Rhizophagus clarus]
MHQMNHIRFYVIIITTRAYNPLIRGNEVYHRTPYAATCSYMKGDEQKRSLISEKYYEKFSLNLERAECFFLFHLKKRCLRPELKNELLFFLKTIFEQLHNVNVDVPERTAPSKLSAFQDLPQFKNLEQHPDLKHYQQSKACNGFETAVPVVGDCAILDIENDELYKQVDNATRSNLDKNKHRVGDLIIQPGKEDNDNAEIIVLRSPGTHASITRAESNRT